MRALWDTEAGRAVMLALGAIVALTAVGLAVLWPRGEAPDEQEVRAGDTASATVLGIIEGGCAQIAEQGCLSLAVRLESGPDAGRATTVTLPAEEAGVDVEVGDAIRVLGLDPASGLGAEQAPLGGGEVERAYVFVDFERGVPLGALVILFVVAVVAFGRRRGALALGGLAAALAVVVAFVVPALVEGGPPLGVALVGGLAVMLLTLPLAHGLGAPSVAAMLGTACALVLTALLTGLLVELASITGVVSEESTLLRGGGEEAPSLRGLVLAGAVIGALGVLGDLTVRQASTAFALRRANPARSALRLYSAALAAGRNHIAATVNTLVLAYLGATLPILVVFTQDLGLGAALQREAVAEEIVATLVGCIGLVAAVPITTGVAAALAVRLPVAGLGQE